MAANVCWGVEVGAGAIKAVKLQRDGDNVNVLDFAIIPHKRVLSTPETDEKEAKRVALGTLVSQRDLSKAAIAVSVAGHSAFARFAKLPPVEPKKIPDIVKFEAVQQIPFPIDDVEWDYQTFASPDSPDVEVGIFAMTRERVMEKIAEWSDFGRVPDVMTLSPLAAYNAIAFDQQFSPQTAGTVIVDIGTTSTDLIVAHAGRLWIRTFPIGGHQFTEALVTAFNLSYVKAEKLKREAETSQHARHILQAMRPVFGDLAQDVQRSIGYYQSLHRDAKLTKLVGLGSTFNLPGLRKFLSQQLGIEVSRLENFSRLKMEGERDKEFQEHAMVLSTACGLALQGLEMQTIGANLMPIAVAREAMWAGKTKWFTAAASILLVAGAASFVKPMMDKTAVAGNVRPPIIDQTKTEVKKLKSEWSAIEGSFRPDPAAPGTLRLTDHREVYPVLLDEVGRMMAAADAKYPAEPSKPQPILFERLDTTYPTATDRMGGLPNPLGGEREGGGAPGDANANPPRVHVTLTIKTTRPDKEADDVVDKAILQWLYANAKREGRPFTYDHVAWRAMSRETIAAEATPGGAPGGPGAGGGGGGPPAPPAPPPGGNPLNNRKPQVMGGGGQEPGRELLPPPGGIPGPGGGGGGSAPPPGQEDVNKIAPLPAMPPAGPAGTRVSTYHIEFDAILTYATKKEGQQ